MCYHVCVCEQMRRGLDRNDARSCNTSVASSARDREEVEWEGASSRGPQVSGGRWNGRGATG